MGNAEAPRKKNYNPSPGDNSAPLGKNDNSHTAARWWAIVVRSGVNTVLHPPHLLNGGVYDWFFIFVPSRKRRRSNREKYQILFALLFFSREKKRRHWDRLRPGVFLEEERRRKSPPNQPQSPHLPPTLLNPKPRKGGGGGRRRSIFLTFISHAKNPNPKLCWVISSPSSSFLFSFLSSFFPTARLPCSTARRRRSWNYRGDQLLTKTVSKTVFYAFDSSPLFS